MSHENDVFFLFVFFSESELAHVFQHTTENIFFGIKISI